MFRKSVKISLVLVYLVIIAGAIVRMTGSGMGCPDWPKCFGHYIPPTQQSEIEWHPQQEFHKGQVIIWKKSLQVAQSDFTSGSNFYSENWARYTKHDYAKFNATHTWVEYINRLSGALAGLSVMLMAIFSFKKWRYKKRLVLLSWLSVFLMGFQGWLGATVVYSLLAPAKITIHMIMALIIVALLLYILRISGPKDQMHSKRPIFEQLLIVTLIFTVIQVALGTQVRQFVDLQVEKFGYTDKTKWLEGVPLVFYIHRSFTILIFLLNAFIWWQNRKLKFGFNLLNIIFGLIIIEILIGIAMVYDHFPYLSQPTHLVLAAILFGLQFYVLMQCRGAKIQSKKL